MLRVNYRNFIRTFLGLGIAIFAFSAQPAFAATPSISSATFKATSDKIMVTFNMPVYSTANGTGALDCNDFTLSSGNGASGIQNLTGATCTHTAGNSWAVIEVADAQAAVAGDTADTIKPVANSIFTVGGALPEVGVSLTSDSTAPTFTVSYLVNTTKALVTFSEPVFTTDYSATATAFNNTALGAPNFAYTDGNFSFAGSVSSVAALTKRTKYLLTLNANLVVGDVDGSGTADQIDVSGGAPTYDIHGNIAASSNKILGGAGTTSDSTAPTISSIEGVIGKPRILVNFSEPVFGNSGSSAALDNVAITNDITYTDTGGGGKTLSAAPAVSHVLGDDWVLLTLSGNIASADLTADTINMVVTSVYDSFGTAGATTTSTIADTTTPVILSITIDKTGATGQNTVAIVYSEPVTVTGGPAAGASAASSGDLGDMLSACSLEGLGTFAAGNLTYGGDKNTIALNAAATTFTITLAGQTGGFREREASPTACSGVFTPIADGGGALLEVQDTSPAANKITATQVHSTITTTNAWDLTNPLTSHAITSIGTDPAPPGDLIILSWTAIADAGSDFREYKVFFGTSAGAGALSGAQIWGGNDEANLLIRTTTTANVAPTAGLIIGTTYYFMPYAIDTFGNVAAAGTELAVPFLTPGNTLTQTGTTDVTEGGVTDSYTVVLSSQPIATVTLTPTPNSQVQVSPSTLTFTTANWNIAQTITVTAVDDATYEGSHTGSITHAITSSDGNYQGMAISTVAVSVIDNDSAPPSEPGGGGPPHYTPPVTTTPSTTQTPTQTATQQSSQQTTPTSQDTEPVMEPTVPTVEPTSTTPAPTQTPNNAFSSGYGSSSGPLYGFYVRKPVVLPPEPAVAPEIVVEAQEEEYVNEIPFNQWEKSFEITINNGLEDRDGDGLSDKLEYKYNTSPVQSDTDGDGFSDTREVLELGSNPRDANSPGTLKKVKPRITGFKPNQLVADNQPLIRGSAAPGATVEFILIDNDGNKKVLGQTKSGENGVYLFQVPQPLNDGDYSLVSRVLGEIALRSNNSGFASIFSVPEAPATEEIPALDSPPIKIKIRASLNVLPPNPKKLADKDLVAEDLIKNLRIVVKDNKPVLYGTTTFGSEVVATWQSIVTTSALIADVASGDFSIRSPELLTAGDHELYVQSIRAQDSALSKSVKIAFTISEKDLVALNTPPAKTETVAQGSILDYFLKGDGLILMVIGGVLIFFGGGFIWFMKSRKKKIS